MKGYKVDFTASTITITADFAKKMNAPTSAEYKTISQIKKDFPQMKIINKTHKTPRKYVSKATGEEFNCNQFKNLTFDNMEQFIEALPNHDKLLKTFKFLRYCGNLPQTSRYPAVRRWFVAQFPKFRKDPLFYYHNEVAVIDITTFIQQAKEEADKKEKEKAEKEKAMKEAS